MRESTRRWRPALLVLLTLTQCDAQEPGGVAESSGASSAEDAATADAAAALDAASLKAAIVECPAKVEAAKDTATRCAISADSYDRSCSADSDCIAVGVGDGCAFPCLLQCPNAAISVGAYDEYRAHVAETPLGACPMMFCGCPAAGQLRCNGGQCELAWDDPRVVDAGL